MRYSTAVPIASGSTGQVFKAWDPLLGRNVALKFLLWDDPILVERLAREARAQAKLEHPNICRIYEVGERDGTPFIAMQFVDGQELGEIAAQLSRRDLVQLMVSVAEAVHSAHRQNLIHRDLKPSNIMVETDEEGRRTPFVLDFGLVQDQAAPSLTQSGQALGTPSFMAPEQVSPSSSEPVDRRTDIWGLGATLFAALLSRPPYLADTPAEVFVKILSEEIPDPSRLDPSLPLDLKIILETCLSKDRQRRYTSALALAEDLQRWLDGEPIRARPPSWTYRWSRRIQRQRAAFTVAGLALVSLLALGSWSIFQRLEANQREATAQRIGAEVQDIEWLMRVGHLLPTHDIRRERAKVRQKLDAFEQEIEGLQGESRAPALYAIGRGLLALGDEEGAWTHLEPSWDLGFRSAEAAYARGLVMGEFFRLETQRARVLPAEEREARLEAIARQWKEPAIDALRRSAESPTVSPAYVKALVAFHEGNWREVLIQADAAILEAPWLYEAHTLAGDALNRLSVDSFRSGDHEDAAAKKSEAEERFAAAVAMAPSWPAGHSGLCGLMATEMHRMIHRRRSAESADTSARALERCETATLVDPDSWTIKMLNADVHRFWGMAQNRTGEASAETLQRAIDLAKEAAELAPGEYRPQLSLADAYLERASALASGEEEGFEFAQQATSSFRRVLELHPRSAAAWNNLGIALRYIASYESSQGLDPSATLEEAVESYLRLAGLMPNLTHLSLNIGLARQSQTDWLMQNDLDALERNVQTIAAAREAVARRPEDASSHGLLALALATRVLLELDRERFVEPATEVLRHARQSIGMAPDEATIYESNIQALAQLVVAHRSLWPSSEILGSQSGEPQFTIGDLRELGLDWCRRRDELAREGPGASIDCRPFGGG